MGPNPFKLEVSPGRPVSNLRENLKSISHICHLFEEAFIRELTRETIHSPLGCLQGGHSAGAGQKEVLKGEYRGHAFDVQGNLQPSFVLNVRPAIDLRQLSWGRNQPSPI